MDSPHTSHSTPRGLFLSVPTRARRASRRLFHSPCLRRAFVRKAAASGTLGITLCQRESLVHLHCCASVFWSFGCVPTQRCSRSPLLFFFAVSVLLLAISSSLSIAFFLILHVVFTPSLPIHTLTSLSALVCVSLVPCAWFVFSPSACSPRHFFFCPRARVCVCVFLACRPPFSHTVLAHTCGSTHTSLYLPISVQLYMYRSVYVYSYSYIILFLSAFCGRRSLRRLTHPHPNPPLLVYSGLLRQLTPPLSLPVRSGRPVLFLLGFLLCGVLWFLLPCI